MKKAKPRTSTEITKMFDCYVVDDLKPTKEVKSQLLDPLRKAFKSLKVIRPDGSEQK